MLLPDPVGGAEGPAALANGLARLLVLVGWATSAARSSTELPSWAQRPWVPVWGNWVAVVSAAGLIALASSLTLAISGHPGAIGPHFVDFGYWTIRLSPWVVLMTIGLGPAASPWAIVLFPFLATWIAPSLTDTRFAGWLPGSMGDSITMLAASRHILVGFGVLAFAAVLTRRRRLVVMPRRCL